MREKYFSAEEFRNGVWHFQHLLVPNVRVFTGTDVTVFFSARINEILILKKIYNYGEHNDFG